MNKILFFLGTDKSFTNLVKYGYFEKIIKKDFTILSLNSSDVALKSAPTMNVISYDSNWSATNIDQFHLYLLLKNFITRNNKALNYDLRNRFLGPYKIKSIKTLTYSFKYFFHAVRKINWLFLLLNFNKSHHQILIQLRNKNFLDAGDYTYFYKILVENKITSVITLTPFRDPKIYDLAQACCDLNISLHILIECWDNISSGYGLPDYITQLYLWSEQQRLEILKFYPKYSTSTQIIGSYRRSYSLDFEKTIISNLDELNILYLEGYFYEDLNFILKLINNLLIESELHISYKKVNIFVRRYPLKRQTIEISQNEDWIGTFTANNCIFTTKKSQILDLNNEFQNIDLVFTELTTAGLEAKFRNIPTFFIGSHASPRFLDSAAGYTYPFAQQIKNSKSFFNLSYKKDRLRLVTQLFEFKINRNLKQRFLNQNEDLNFYAEPFDFLKWNNLIDKISI